MGKTARPKNTASRVGKQLPRTKQTSQDKDTGQQNITSFFGKDSVSVSELWTTISSAKKGQKRHLSLSTKKSKATPRNVKSPATKQHNNSSSPKACQVNSCLGGTPSALTTEKDSEVQATVSEDDLEVLACSLSEEHSTPSLREDADVSLKSGDHSNAASPSIFSDTWSECTGNDCSVVIQDPKPSVTKRNKNLLSVQRKRPLGLHKKIQSPVVNGNTSGIYSNPEEVKSWNGSPYTVDQQHTVIDSEDDFIPPTPIPATRHRLLKSRISSLRSKKEKPPLKTAKPCATSSVSRSDERQLASQQFEKTRDMSSVKRNVSKEGVYVTEGEAATMADNINVDDSETGSSLSKRTSHNDVSFLTVSSTRKAYKLSRKRNPWRVTSSPVKLKSTANGSRKDPAMTSKEVENVVDLSGEQRVVIAPSKCKLSRSKAQPVKRPANTGSSPAHKRKHTAPMIKDSAKCNLFDKIECESVTSHEKPTGFENNAVEEEQSNAHLLECYGVDGKVSEIFVRQDITDNDTKENNYEEKNSSLVQNQNSADSSHDVRGEKINYTVEANSRLETEVGGFSESELPQSSAKTSGNEAVTDNRVSPRKIAVELSVAKSPSSLSSHDRQAVMNVSQIGTVNEDILNASRDSLMDVDVDVDIGNLLDGVEWSPMLQGAGRQEKAGSTSITPRSLFPPNEDFAKCSTTPDDSTRPGSRGYSRFLVLEVYRREMRVPPGAGAVPRNRPSTEKVLRLFDEENTAERFCYLREDWQRTEVEPGDTVHVTGTFDLDSGVCVLDNQADHYVVVHPDTLVSGTTVSMATRCLRRSILNERFKTEGQNEAMLMGTLLHDLFDVAMTTQEFSVESLVVQAKKLLRQQRYLNDLYSVGETEVTALNKIQEQIPRLSSWADRFIVPSPRPDRGVMDFRTTSSSLHSDEQPSVCIAELKDIEENIWSPRFGLKGKVDATVQVKIDRRPRMKRHRADTLGQVQTAVIPLELKTGRMSSQLGSVEHRAQVILYTLLMSDRRCEPVESGLLFYMKAAHMLGVPAFLHEKRALIMRRNEVARYLALDKATGTRVLPGMLKDLNTCSRCPQAQNCVNFHKAVENGDRLTSGLGDLFDDLTKHLSISHIDYFADWFRLIYLEGKEAAEKNNQKEIWCLGGLEREKRGRCFGSMVLKSRDRQAPCADERFFVHVFERSADHPCEVALVDVPITCGDRVIVGEEHAGAVALSSGFIKEVKEQEVMVLLDRDLTDRCNVEGRNTAPTLYRLDRDDGYSALTTSLSNVAKLLKGDSDIDAKLRRLIIDLEPPAFSRRRRKDISDYFGQTPTAAASASQEISSQTSSSLSSQSDSILQELNPDQKNAVSKALSAQDYALILGMPGTGKTTTIACLVRVLVASGKTVLLTSYTHTAVDNILLKLKQAGLDFLRLGQTHKILPELHTFTLQEAASDVTTVHQLRHFYESKSVVATTCLGVNHALFNQRSFDFCIVDEASQITQPTCLGPLRHARVFILVGDHYQLPPLVQSVEAREGGMDVSLFKRLSEHHPQSVVSLEHQYRMNSDIMELTNALIYEGRLKCGTEGVATALLEVPLWDELSRMIRQEAPGSWLLKALDPSRPVVFLDTDKIPAPETRSDHLVSNEKEATLVQQLTYGFLQGGVPASAIGVISPYRHQLKLITQMLQSLRENIEINTVDKYQGRDKPCIVVSLVRSNAHANVGDLLKDWRRVNVAVTRAKRKLVLIGSLTTLRGSLLLQELFHLLASRDWIHVIPSGAQYTFKFLTESSLAQQDN